MSFFKRIFQTTPTPSAGPDIRFGRYTDSYKEPENYQAWDQAVEAFEGGQYLNSIREFIGYLRDKREDNVLCTDEGDVIRFELHQGSRIISGIANAHHVKAEAKVAKAKTLNVAFMRRLVEHNFNFNYCRYALDPENNITAVFDTFTLDGSPYKIYYALKELALHADKQDDLLLDEFDVLEPISSAPLIPIPEHEKQAKYEYITRETEKALAVMDSGRLDKDQYPGGIGYLLLHLIYKLDYLTQPQGYMMEALERMNRLYFSSDEKNAAQKNLLLAKELKQLVTRPTADFFKEMYRTTATFGITTPVNHAQIAGFIEGELPNMTWYYEQGHQEIALAVPGFIVGYCLFHYAPPKPVKELLHLYVQITEADFFNALGFPYLAPGLPDRKFVRQAVQRIVQNNRGTYPRLAPGIHTLQYKDMPSFCRSFLEMLAAMEVVKEA